MTHRPIYKIAEEIIAYHRENGVNVYYAAAPYVRAMRYLDTVSDSYGEDSAKSVLLYAKSNLRYWKGETARRVKAEMQAIIDGK